MPHDRPCVALISAVVSHPTRIKPGPAIGIGLSCASSHHPMNANKAHRMGIELPPEYQPSGDEEFMNSRQVAYFGRRLEESRADLLKELAAAQPSEADDSSRVGDRTDHASAESEREFM